MIDKLELCSDDIIEPRTIEGIFGNNIKRIPDPHYQICFQVNEFKEPLVIKCSPSPYYRNASQLKIILNPSRWLFFNELNSDLAKFCSIEKLKITRIDHAVDLEIPLNTVREQLLIKFKAASRFFKDNESFDRGRLTGMNFGKRPEYYCIYDKAYQMNKNNLARSRGKVPEISTRIELRQLHSKISSPLFKDLRFYLTETPFKHIESYVVDEANDSKKAEELKKVIVEKGFINARHLFNRKNNFSRDYLSLLIPSPMKGEILSRYHSNLKKFFIN